MTQEPKITAALIYDFDGTLAPGNMQEYDFIPAVGQSNREFWNDANSLAEEQDADMTLTYMAKMLEAARSRKLSLRREAFQESGRNIRLFPGVKEWFGRINAYAAARGVRVLHYINSSGLKEMIEGTPIASEFRKIYACSFLYDVDGIAYWPGVAVNYTNKTQFIFKINKGVESVSDCKLVNQYIEERERPVPFSRMIYVGDGTTDIPCMRLVKNFGGHSIAVYNPASGEGRAQGPGVAHPRQPRQPRLCGRLYRRVGDRPAGETHHRQDRGRLRAATARNPALNASLMKIVFATNNRPQARRGAGRAGRRFYELVTPRDVRRGGGDSRKRSRRSKAMPREKSHYLRARTGLDCFADDTGLEVEALDGAPGVHSARYASDGHDFAANNRLLLRNLEGVANRRARFRTVISLLVGDEEHLFEGVVEGRIVERESGAEGFGYDPLFVPDGCDRTFAEMSPDEKNAVSHRGRAVRKLAAFLRARGEK